MIYLNKKLIKVDNNSNFLFLTYSTNAKDLTKNILNPWFITGFANAEGSFIVLIRKKITKKKVKPFFFLDSRLFPKLSFIKKTRNY